MLPSARALAKLQSRNRAALQALAWQSTKESEAMSVLKGSSPQTLPVWGRRVAGGERGASATLLSNLTRGDPAHHRYEYGAGSDEHT
jgi:hypothetical protein